MELSKRNKKLINSYDQINIAKFDVLNTVKLIHCAFCSCVNVRYFILRPPSFHKISTYSQVISILYLPATFEVLGFH